CILSVSHTSYSGLEFTPTLSTIYVNAYEMGQRSMELLLQQLKPEPRQEIDHYVPYQYIERDSTKKPPSLPVC
ncbi:MAG: substrate-binding domain-containing protein, partial [Lachnospiraceae bacterium]|nr:substrate-binding domain-containing protein [Lachnospiraceae bacterium]